MRAAAGVIGTVVLVAGCARGPVLADSAEQLGFDTRAVLVAGADQLGVPGARPRVLLDATRACADGRARRLYRAELPLRPGATSGVVLDRATELSVDLIGARGYHLDGPPSRHAFSMTRGGPAVRLAIRLRGGHRPALELDGSTPCLATD